MKVLMVSPSYLPIKGGVEVFVHNITEKLNQVGIQTDVLTFNMNNRWAPKWQRIEENANGFHVTREAAVNFFYKIGKDPFGRFLNINAFPKIDWIKDFGNYDIIHYHDEGDLSFPFFSLLNRRNKIYQCHGMESRYGFYLKHPLSKYIFKKSAQVFVVPSRSGKEAILRLGFDKSKIRVIPLGVKVERFIPGNYKEENMLLFVGRIEVYKGLHILLESLSLLKDSIHLVIIGPMFNNPRSYNYEYCQMITRQIEKINMQKRHKITYIGPLDQDQLLFWYQKASIFVCPSFMEAFGIVNLEALSCETPVVASNVGGIRDVILDHQDGILIPSKNPEKLGRSNSVFVGQRKCTKALWPKWSKRCFETLFLYVRR